LVVTIETFVKGAMLVDVSVPAGTAMLPRINIKLPNTVKLPSSWIKSGPLGGCTNTKVMAAGLIVYGA
jgi:hypothetical protein